MKNVVNNLTKIFVKNFVKNCENLLGKIVKNFGKKFQEIQANY